ncbi:hypothetical protein THII_0820 [Thioploca ingrica]|uniref:Uncharacterized protein n=1 Tax=Thioploca ingrica TaxID=40754 RepID=A0A090AIB3_9GAMM|nr:hypothetical protein THII_0820 [Thioploca ingrica]
MKKITSNSFPTQAISTPGLPPFFAVHGIRDTVVPFQQSLAFCLALSGDQEWESHVNGLFSGKTKLTSEDLTQLVTQQYPDNPTSKEITARDTQQTALTRIGEKLAIR